MAIERVRTGILPKEKKLSCECKLCASRFNLLAEDLTCEVHPDIGTGAALKYIKCTTCGEMITEFAKGIWPEAPEPKDDPAAEVASKGIRTTTGKRWNEFLGYYEIYSDEDSSLYIENMLITIDGIPHDEAKFKKIPDQTLRDDALVVICKGLITGEEDQDDVELLDAFIDWEYQQTHFRYTLDVPKSARRSFEQTANDLRVRFIKGYPSEE